MISSAIRGDVETLLLADLHRLEIEATGLTVDWTDVVPGGGQSVSNLQLLDDAGLAYWGWIDCIVTRNGTLHAYWTCMGSRHVAFAYYRSFGIPDPLWGALSADDRQYLAETGQGWHSDPRMLPYRKVFVLDSIKTLSAALDARMADLPTEPRAFGLDMDIFRAEATKVLDLAGQLIAGRSVSPNISTQTYRLHVASSDATESPARRDVEALRDLLLGLENQVRSAAVWSGQGDTA